MRKDLVEVFHKLVAEVERHHGRAYGRAPSDPSYKPVVYSEPSRMHEDWRASAVWFPVVATDKGSKPVNHGFWIAEAFGGGMVALHGWAHRGLVMETTMRLDKNATAEDVERLMMRSVIPALLLTPPLPEPVK
jgi:hypothetical protein